MLLALAMGSDRVGLRGGDTTPSCYLARRPADPSSWAGGALQGGERSALVRAQASGHTRNRGDSIMRRTLSAVAAMRAAGIPNDVHIYDDTQHGFWLYVDRDPATNIEPAADARARLKAYLRRVLGD